ncbi:MAG: single-stranded DNA-binding protein [Chloroflexi bacterium]|nr:single-stranded DNA-binding protein [Chloroflexota bacterium]
MLNKMLVIGNVGRDPEMRYTPNGNAVTSFSLAVNRYYTPAGGERQEETEWFNVVAWNRLAETCNNYVTRGMKIYVEGRLRSNSWVGQDGQTRFRNEIIANTVQFLDRRQGSGGYGGPPGEPSGGGGYGGGYGADGEYGGGPGEPSDADDLPW